MCGAWLIIIDILLYVIIGHKRKEKEMTTKTTTTTTTKVLIQSSLEGKPYKPFGLSAIALEKYKKQEEGETLDESIEQYGND